METIFTSIILTIEQYMSINDDERKKGVKTICLLS